MTLSHALHRAPWVGGLKEISELSPESRRSWAQGPWVQGLRGFAVHLQARAHHAAPSLFKFKSYFEGRCVVRRRCPPCKPALFSLPRPPPPSRAISGVSGCYPACLRHWPNPQPPRGWACALRQHNYHVTAWLEAHRAQGVMLRRRIPVCCWTQPSFALFA